MTTYVPDASVLLKWVLQESEDEHDLVPALRLKDDFVAGNVRFVVPDLWYFEVGNVLAIKHHRDAEASLRGLLALRIPTAASGPGWLRRTLEVVDLFKVSFYDACYHALALEEGGEFITADERYIRRAGALGHVRHLRDYR